MPAGPGSGQNGDLMTTFPPPAVLPAEPQQADRLYRAQHGRVLGGVAGALADHLGLPRKYVRLAFVALSFSSGLGVLLYGAFWIVLQTRSSDGRERSIRSAAQYLIAAVAAAGVLLVNAHTLPLGWWFTPSLLACFGGALLWRQA